MLNYLSNIPLGEVSDSRRVFQTVQEKKPRILVYSVGTPSLPDLERISALRHEFSDILILALVDGNYRGQERMALDYGAHRVLTKAAPRAELLEAVRNLSRQITLKSTSIKREVLSGA